MKRPAWAAAPNFSRVWSAVESSRGVPGGDRTQLLERLRDARVIAVDAEQVQQLPFLRTLGESGGAAYERMVGELHALTPPFATVFVDLGGISLPDYPEHESAKVLGGLVGVNDYDDGEPRTFIAPFVEINNRIFPGWDAVVAATPTRLGTFQSWAGLPWDGGPQEAQMATSDAAERVLAVLLFLAAFNVELVEAPLSARQRGREAMKGRQIALTVQVKQSKRYTSHSETNGHANYSHRFETRGHYKHHFELKPDGEPSKTFAACYRKDVSRLIEVDGKPCFRFWVPPFIKGPSDKPFVPKVRVVEQASTASPEARAIRDEMTKARASAEAAAT